MHEAPSFIDIKSDNKRKSLFLEHNKISNRDMPLNLYVHHFIKIWWTYYTLCLEIAFYVEIVVYHIHVNNKQLLMANF